MAFLLMSATLAASIDGENARRSTRPALEAGRGASWAICVDGRLRGNVRIRTYVVALKHEITRTPVKNATFR